MATLRSVQHADQVVGATLEENRGRLTISLRELAGGRGIDLTLEEAIWLRDEALPTLIPPTPEPR